MYIDRLAYFSKIKGGRCSSPLPPPNGVPGSSAPRKKLLYNLYYPMFHLLSINTFPNFTGRLCHFGVYYWEAKQASGKASPSQDPARGLRFLVLFLGRQIASIMFMDL